MEKFFLGDFVRFGMMPDENDLDVAVTGRNELVEQEEKAAREVLLHRVHRARSIHYANDDGIGLFARVGLDMLVAQVALMEREALAHPRGDQARYRAAIYLLGGLVEVLDFLGRLFFE